MSYLGPFLSLPHPGQADWKLEHSRISPCIALGKTSQKQVWAARILALNFPLRHIGKYQDGTELLRAGLQAWMERWMGALQEDWGKGARTMQPPLAVTPVSITFFASAGGVQILLWRPSL